MGWITWQDAAMMVANIIFIVAMIPTLRSKDGKPALTTSIWITVGMVLMVVADAALEQYWSAFFMGSNTLQWVGLGWQRWRLDRAKSDTKWY